MDSLAVLMIATLTIICVVCCARIWKLTAELNRERRKSSKNSAFIRNLSKEIQTPLKSINHNAEIVAREDIYLSKDEKKTIAGQMAYNVNLITTLLDEMKGCVDSDGGREVRQELFSLTLMCRRCVDSNLSNTYLKNGVKMSFKREMADDIFVSSDMRIVELIINKMLITACKFTDKGEIVVGCNTTEVQGRLTIYVQDTGRGIPENRRKVMFDWFEHPATEGDNEIEFDLSVAQKMALKLGGTLRQDETYHQGVRMLLLLPMG